MQSGKCKDLTFEECLAQHPSYCSWVLARGDKLSTAEYGDFLNFLRNRTQAVSTRCENGDKEAPADPQPAHSGGGHDSESDHVPDPRDQNKVGFGKHKDLTYAELLSKQPAYCLWVQQAAAQGDKAGAGMRAFADYLEGKTIAAASNPQRKPRARTASSGTSPASGPNLAPNTGRGTLADGSWLVNFGKYKGSSFSEVYTKDPQYCEFITNSVLLADDQAKAPSRDSLAFTAYIQHRAFIVIANTLESQGVRLEYQLVRVLRSRLAGQLAREVHIDAVMSVVVFVFVVGGANKGPIGGTSVQGNTGEGGSVLMGPKVEHRITRLAPIEIFVHGILRIAARICSFFLALVWCNIAGLVESWQVKHLSECGRNGQRRNQLLDELRKKEAEECTFQPKTLSRGSPRTFSRPDTTGEVKWEQRLDQRKRDQRLKQVEAQHYAELTLKPKISPFAQAWSQKQAEAVRESPSTNSVFERLYQAALQQEEKQTAAKRERESDQAECLSPPPPISNRNSPPRRIPTSELLYSDALDRRERLRIMTEQMQLRREEETKERCAVLYKSSRLYYQLIEKQIKVAMTKLKRRASVSNLTNGWRLFNVTSNYKRNFAASFLLGKDFLVRFKCMRVVPLCPLIGVASDPLEFAMAVSDQQNSVHQEPHSCRSGRSRDKQRQVRHPELAAMPRAALKPSQLLARPVLGAMPRSSNSKQQKDEEFMTLTLPHADAKYANPDIRLGQEFPTRFSHLISLAHVLGKIAGDVCASTLVHSGIAFVALVASRSSTDGQLRWAASAAASLLLTYTVTLQPANAADVVNYSDFLESVKKGDVEMVRVQNDMLSAQYTTKDGARRDVNLIPNAQIEDELFNTLADKKVDVVMQNSNAGGSPFDFLARFAGPIAWLIAGLLLLFGGLPFGGRVCGMSGFLSCFEQLGTLEDGDTKVKFADVAGCDGAKQELVEVVDFLKNTSRYSELGAKIPKGALLVGPPGTGKTLLAKAVAGEAGVPFFSISASEFVEIFAGIGASRVRDLFEQAKKSAPCIIFIDEIDAVGRQRSAGFGQGNDEREQTVNQLLTEMDGFESNKGVVVIAATNRADILDQALVRPGRFDRQIQVDPPDVQGRTEILKVHAKDKNLAPGVDLSAIARQTPGMSGADLANLLNEGAIQAARSNKAEIDPDDIFNALERISIGLEKKDAVMSEQKKKLVAYHEAGHAILGALMNDYDVVAKISIVPRGPAGGVTIFMPSEDRLNSGLYSKEFLENRMCVALGGRLAEEIINGRDNVTTGASNDFQQCTQVAKTMVMQLGMSPEIGQRLLGGQQQGGPFMGRDFMGGGAPPMSQALKQTVDAEVKRIVDEQYQRGMKLLRDNMYLLDTLAKTLMEEEKVSGDQLMKMINQAAAEGKLVMGNSKMAVAACVSEKVAADDLESARLQAALWRHLDPNKVGHTDLKTVTLFFHVLMGAVDDAVQNAGSAMEEPGASPSKSTASEGGSIALQSINEEGFAEAVDKGDSVLAALSKTAGIQEDEDRRLVELLLRFDPLRLRTEFQPLLLHRMHYQGMAAQAEQERSPRKEEGPNVVNPVIDAQSRSLAEKLLEKQKSESGKATHAELLFWRHKQVQARKESLRKQLSQEEEKGCTFRPKCNPSKPKDGHVEIQTPPGSTRSEVLYARGLADKERRKAKVLESEKARSTAEARGCTFRPNLSKSVNSYHKTQKNTQQVPRGFYETRQRIRAAYEIREKVLQQQEDRMAKIEQTVPYQVSGTTSAPLVGKSPLPSTGNSPGLSPVPESPTKGQRPGKAAATGHTSFTPPWRSGNQADGLEEGIRTEAEGGGLDSQPATGDEGNAEGNASPKERAQEDIPPDAPPMLYVDVNITQGQPAERIVLYQGQNVSEVAAEFAAKHVLTPALAQKLHTLLREVVLKQELQNQARLGACAAEPQNRIYRGDGFVPHVQILSRYTFWTTAMATQVLECGGVVTYQFLCGREIARKDRFATQMANYCYLVVNTLDRSAIAVDAAWDVEGLYKLAAELEVTIRGCVYTHYHFDHCGGDVHPMFTGGQKVFLSGAKEVEDAGGTIWAGQGDAEQIQKQCSLKEVVAMRDGDVIPCGDLVLHILRTPGHTPGSICVFAAPRGLSPRSTIGSTGLKEARTKAEAGLLITGDTLFVGSCGRTDLPGSDPREMMSSLARLSTMDPAVVVCPGHNYAAEPFTTIGAERAQNEMVIMGLSHFPSPPPVPPCAMCGEGGQICGPKKFRKGRKVRIVNLASEAGQADCLGSACYDASA
ncbi:FTSH1 [Symbiodinium sp. CCMP2456]|nr:FTSH1 [Symbiodinium sp. CCMP2456]